MVKSYPYMPSSTAQWLIENTSLTFEQIADFCGLHELEVSAIANAEVRKIQGLNPILNGQLTKEEIVRCEQDPEASLSLSEIVVENKKSQDVKSKYVPMILRQNRVGGIVWIIKNYPEIPDTQIAKLMRSTKKTVEAIRSKQHPGINQIQNPVVLGLVSEYDLQKAVEKIRAKAEKAQKKSQKIEKSETQES